MRFILRRSAAAALLLATLTTTAHAVEIAKLGDFEDTTLGAWTVSRLSAGGDPDWLVSDDGTYSPITSSPAYLPSGNWQAVADCDGPYGTGILSRLVTIPANADTLKLRFWYRGTVVSDVPDLNPGGQGQGVRVDVLTSGASITGMSGILHTLFATSYPANAADDLPPRTLALGVQSLRGQTVRLRIAAVSNTAPMIVGVDDVLLEGSQFEEIAGTGLPNLRDGAADWGDFDGDGDLDLAIEGTDGTTRHAAIYRNDGATFSLFASAPDGFENGDVKWLDTDRDGDLDVFFNGTRTSGAWTWVGRNTGAGFTWNYVPHDMDRCNLAIADCDADGDMDLAGSRSGAMAVYRNDGAGGFTEFFATGGNPNDSLLVFWDELSDYPSLHVQGTSSTYQLNVWNNTLAGTQFTVGTRSFGLIAGCRANNGRPRGNNDYVYSSGRASTGGLLSGASWNRSTTLTTDVPSVYDGAATWGEFDLDVNPDLFVAGSASGTAYARLHRGSGLVLEATTDLFTAVTRAACAPGDYDNDGDLDLLVLGESAGGPVTKLYRNALTTVNNPPGAPSAAGSWSFHTPTQTFLLTGSLSYTDDHSSSAWSTLNFRAGTTPGGTDVITPDSDPVSGDRRVARTGNSRGVHYLPLSATVLRARHAPIYFASQAVDQQFKGGAWGPEASLILGPTLTAVTDVPGDQGGEVRLALTASPMDAAGTAFPTTAYNVYGRVNSAALAAQVARAAASREAGEPAAEGELVTLQLGERRFVAPAAALAAGFPAGTWEVLTSFAALQSGSYTVRVSTVADSGVSGPNWSVFVASAHSADPGMWWLSPADSGKSVDNIAPGAPQGVQLSYHPGTHNALSWQPSAAEDFQYFRVYRGTTPGFAIGAATLVGNTADVSWTDPAPGATNVYYKVTALDHAGNESAAASPSVTTDVDGGAAPEYAFALAAPSPSPFAARTAIAFTLPTAQHARLEVFDAAGRRVAKLADGAFAAGPHAISWDGSADGGARANAGLLFVRLSAGGREAVKRLVLLGGTP